MVNFVFSQREELDMQLPLFPSPQGFFRVFFLPAPSQTPDRIELGTAGEPVIIAEPSFVIAMRYYVLDTWHLTGR